MIRLTLGHVLLLALYLVGASAVDPPCFPRCRFVLCDQGKQLRVSSSGSKARSTAICSGSGATLGIVGSTGEARVRSGGTVARLGEYAPGGLRQRFSPSFLKAVTVSSRSSGITHEHLQQNQFHFIDGLCVAVPLKSAQILDSDGHVLANQYYSDPNVDCVALTLRGSSTVEPSTPPTMLTHSAPTPAAEVTTEPGPTTPPLSETPSAPGLGTDVAMPSPDLETSTPTPTQSETLPVTGNGPVPSKAFRRLTFASGSSAVNKTVRREESRFGVTSYRLDYDFELIPAGIVSLDDAASIVRSVRCTTDGSARIVLNPNAKVNTLAEMYPKGAILIVNRDIYGECNLEEFSAKLRGDQRNYDTSDASAENRALMVDGYLRIVSVTGSPYDAVVRGVSVAFPALFKRASIYVTNLNDVGPTIDTLNSTSVRMGTNNALTEYSESLSLGRGLIDLEFKTRIENRNEFKVFAMEITTTGMDVRVTSVVDFSLALEVIATMKVTVSPRTFEKTFDTISIPIPGAGVGTNLMVESGSDLISFPLKFGFFFELPLITSTSISIERQLSTPMLAKYNSGRKEVNFWVTGPYYNLDYGATPLVNVPYSTDFRPPRLIGLGSEAENTEIQVKMLIVVRPKVSFYASFFEARISVDVGAEMVLKGLLGSGTTPYPPVTSKALGDTCDVCHLVEFEYFIVVQNFGLFLTNTLKFEGALASRLVKPIIERFFPRNIYSITLPDNPSFKDRLFTACFWKLADAPKGTELCGTTCCDDTDADTCSLNGGPSGGAVCTAKPTPNAGTQSVNPVPTACTLDGVRGACLDINTAACSGGNFVPGQCPGPANVQCCIKETPAPTAPVANLYTDPHLKTFDGLRYSCQGVGEFILVKSGSGFEVQGRFHGNATRLSASVTVGIAVKAPGSPKIQVSIPGGSDCTAPSVYVDGVPKPAGAFKGVEVESTSIEFNSGSKITWRLSASSVFGCYFEQLSVRLGPSDVGRGLVSGLLGSPDGNLTNDWITRDGKKLTVPGGSGRYNKESYEYCTKQWCLRNSAESLFVYGNGTTFAALNSCDAPYRAVALSDASPELRTLCAGDVSCLFDGLATGSLPEARRALRARRELEAEEASLSSLVTPGRELLGKQYKTYYAGVSSVLEFKTQKRISEGRFDYEVTAVYAEGIGSIFGKLDVEKRQLVGNWSNPAGSCSSVHPKFSGRMVFKFSPDWRTAVGSFDRCFRGRNLSWMGSQVFGGEAVVAAPKPSTPPKPISLTTNGRELAGKNYSTNFNKMVFETQRRVAERQYNYTVGAYYQYHSGRIFASLDVKKRELIGVWSEDRSGCSTVGPHGHNYWGMMVFKFAPDWSSFDGKWGRCTGAPSSRWTGTLIRN